MTILSKKNKSDPAALAKARAIIEELEIKNDVFKEEARIRARRLEDDMEEARHEFNVDEHEIKEEVDLALQMINEAASAIVLPSGDA